MAPDLTLLRSWLIVPGDSPRKLERCWEADADVVVLDLEDGVRPERKAEARALTAAAVVAARGRRSRRFVRINAPGSRLALDDLAATLPSRPDGYFIPKLASPDEIGWVSSELARLEAAAGVRPGSTALVPIVTEVPAAVFRLEALCRADPRIGAVLWGSEDLSAAMGARRAKRPDGRMLDVFRVVRSLALLAATAAGIGAIDTPVVEIPDVERLREESVEAAWMGFTGKLAIHPAQVPVINEAFLPSGEELERARALVTAAREAGEGVFRFRDQMIDLPHVRAAERLVALAAAMDRGGPPPPGVVEGDPPARAG